LADTKTLMASWDDSLSLPENLDRFRRENIFGKASRSRVDDILNVLRKRYLSEPDVTRALVCLADGGLPAESMDPILYFHAALADPLLLDLVVEFFGPMHEHGLVDVSVDDVEGWIKRKIDEGKTCGPWSESTKERSASALVTALRDFGILRGKRKKRLQSLYLPAEAFSYISFYLGRSQPSGKRLIEDPLWRLFFLSPIAVEHLFMEAHQMHLLSYQAAGSVIIIEFPAKSLGSYAHVILNRPH